MQEICIYRTIIIHPVATVVSQYGVFDVKFQLEADSNPSCLQATLAALLVNPFPHTVPHPPSLSTSVLPAVYWGV